MNFTSQISEKIKNISIKENIIHIGEVKKFNGNISKTANFIGMERSAWHRKLKQLEINEEIDSWK